MKSKSSIIQLPIPLNIRIGVTGHRKLEKKPLIRVSVTKTLSMIEKSLNKTPHSFTVISPLAEGSDRLVVEEILSRSGKSVKADIEVILPLTEKEYIKDFTTTKSQKEFKEILKQAKNVKITGKSNSRENAYKKAGHAIIQSSDILIAIWNGKPAGGKGGTGEIVEYARNMNKHIYWINSENGKIVAENQEKSIIKYLNTYNQEKLSNKKLEKGLNSYYNFLAANVKNSSLPPKFLDTSNDEILPNFIRSDLLALRYQNYHNLAGITIYALAVAAVATITIQLLFFPSYPQLIWFEVGEILIILALILAGEFGDWHRKWIDYRFLAENLRTSLFLRMAGIQSTINKPPPHLRISSVSEDWIINAFNWIGGTGSKADNPIPVEKFKKFLIKAWINDQINYYSQADKKNNRKHKILSRLGALFFVLTLMAATIHASGIAEEFSHEFSNILISAAIILPALGASMAGIRVQREYQRNAKRYAQMAHYLSNISVKLNKIHSLEGLVEILEEANQMMLGEHQDWRVELLFHKLEPP